MHNYQQNFVEVAIGYEVLRFGDFTLKSGRRSPYFFDIGLFNTGESLAQLGTYYAQVIVEAKLSFDMLFGPAYKGIPLVATTAIALAEWYQRDVSFCFNRKEAKTHGEGGTLIGAPLAGRVLLIDDVITAGTAINESVQIIQAHGAQLAGVVVALDRQERGQTQHSALMEVQQTYGVPIISIINLNAILTFLSRRPDIKELFAAMQTYRDQYGVEVPG